MSAAAAHLITAAISSGVPRFNNGDAAGCARIYSDCVAELLTVAPAHAPHLMQALERSAACADDNARAWELRHTLDDVLLRLRAGAEGQADLGPGSLPLTKMSFAPVDDRVMGGSSQSRVTMHDGAVVFEGTLVVAGGGFASVRAMLEGSKWSGAAGLALTCVGDGRAGYKVVLKSDGNFDGVTYQHSLPLSTTQTVMRLPFHGASQQLKTQAAIFARPSVV